MNRTKRSIALSIALLSTVIIVITASFNTVHDANATGGAFPYSKHGGGTTDGLTPYDIGNGPGVDRAVNPDYVTHFNSLNPEAGKYKGGECTQCHEPHASFGGSEAPPSAAGDAGPDLYLALKEYGTSANYANLCWYCHEKFININGSGSPPGKGRWSFYQGMTVYQSSSHYLNSNFYWPGTSGDPAVIWPRQSRSGQPSGNKGSCLNCHSPHGVKEGGASTAFDISAVPTSPTDLHLAANNASVSTDYLIPRQLIAWEEALCENCHDASGPSTKNIQDEINKRSPSPSSVPHSGHPVDDTGLAGRHVASESLPITTKHVECYDCHNPHAVSSTNRVEGMKFVDIAGTVHDPAAGFRQPFVYEICLKCHGNSFNTFIPDQTATNTLAELGGTLRTTVAQYGCAPNINPASSCTDGSNKRLEFDTATNPADGFGGTLAGNRAYHPVAAPGRNTSAALNNQLLGGLTNTSTINCTDCHNNEATGAGTFTGTTATPTYPGPVTQSNLRATDVNTAYGISPVGPHGSTNVRVLRANYNTSLGTTSAAPFASFDAANFALCFNCHNINAFTDADGLDASNNPLTNFRQPKAFNATAANLHAAHLTNNSAGPGWDYIVMYTACANCHYNVHSNAEATNTQYGTATGAGLPPDGDTHLVNFSPIIAPFSYAKPRWWIDESSAPFLFMRCDLKCHGVNMGPATAGNTADAFYIYDGGS